MHCAKAWSPYVTPGPLDRAESQQVAIPAELLGLVRNSTFALATYHICRTQPGSPVDEQSPENRLFLSP